MNLTETHAVLQPLKIHRLKGKKEGWLPGPRAALVHAEREGLQALPSPVMLAGCEVLAMTLTWKTQLRLVCHHCVTPSLFTNEFSQPVALECLEASRRRRAGDTSVMS